VSPEGRVAAVAWLGAALASEQVGCNALTINILNSRRASMAALPRWLGSAPPSPPSRWASKPRHSNGLRRPHRRSRLAGLCPCLGPGGQWLLLCGCSSPGSLQFCESLLERFVSLSRVRVVSLNRRRAQSPWMWAPAPPALRPPTRAAECARRATPSSSRCWRWGPSLALPYLVCPL